MGVAVRQVRSLVRKGTTYTAQVPTVIGMGEQESRQDGHNGEASEDDGSKRDNLYSTGSYRNWHR
jgi:hypothetical protein